MRTTRRKGTRRVVSVVMTDDLQIRLKVAAAQERTNVSALLCRLAEDYLARAKKEGRT